MWSGAENENSISIVNFFRAKAFKNEVKVILSNYADDRNSERYQGLQQTISITYWYTVPWRDYIQQTRICYGVKN